MYDLLIVGAGPAGMMAAIQAGRRGLRVLLCDKQDKPGRKLLASGGGRCNLTNTLDAEAMAARFHQASTFVAPTLREHDASWLRAFFAKLGVATHAPDGFHVFPESHRAADVHAALLGAVDAAGVHLRLGCRVQALLLNQRGCQGLRVDGQEVTGERVLLACGGRGYPQLGGDGSGLDLADQAGHRQVEPLPAMVPLLTRERWPGRCTSVTAGGATLRIVERGQQRVEARGDVIFTRQGLAGPLIQDLSREISARLTRGPVALRLNVSKIRDEALWEQTLLAQAEARPRLTVEQALAAHSPGPLARVLAQEAEVGVSQTLGALNKKQRRRLAQRLAWLELEVVATEGWLRAMVTRGGLCLDQIDAHSLQSRLQRGLFFAGEMLDVDGPCGGFNLQWAFASGARAGVWRDS